MEDANVAIRLKGFIDSQGLSHSQFSDRCGIPRPSLSQILSGRNKKVSDVIVGQIHRAFPQLSVLWLLFGEGPMLTSLQNSPSDGDESQNIGFSRTSNPDFPDSVSSPGEGQGFSSSLFDDVSEFDSVDYSSVPSQPHVASGAASRNSSISGDAGKIFRNSGSEIAGNPNANTVDEKFSNVNALNAVQNALQRTKKQLLDSENRIAELQMQIEKMKQNPRRVSHITVYYDDSTFETFFTQRD